MIYLDYSANTPVDEAVLERFCAVERSCPGNANSRHQAGAAAKAAIDEATQSIARSLNVQPAEIIYTSGASEANNFALKSIARLERHHGKHIISTPLEHSSVSGTLTALQEQGYEIDLVDINRTARWTLPTCGAAAAGHHSGGRHRRGQRTGRGAAGDRDRRTFKDYPPLPPACRAPPKPWANCRFPLLRASTP